MVSFSADDNVSTTVLQALDVGNDVRRWPGPITDDAVASAINVENSEHAAGSRLAGSDVRYAAVVLSVESGLPGPNLSDCTVIAGECKSALEMDKAASQSIFTVADVLKTLWHNSQSRRRQKADSGSHQGARKLRKSSASVFVCDDDGCEGGEAEAENKNEHPATSGDVKESSPESESASVPPFFFAFGAITQMDGDDSVANATAHTDTSRADEPVSFFLEESANAKGVGAGLSGMGGGLVGALAAPAVNDQIHPAVDQTSDLFTQSLSENFNGKFCDALEIGLERGSYYELAHGLTTEITQALTDSVSESVSQQLTPVLVANMKDWLQGEVVGAVGENLIKMLLLALSRTVPKTVIRLLVPYVTALIVRIVTRILTREMTHVLVPALAHSMAVTPNQEYYCYYCQTTNQYCNMCKNTALRAYYTSFYADFNAAYYSDYFA